MSAAVALALILSSILVGVIGAIALLAAPAALATLGAETAGVYLRRLSPRYFAAAGVLAVLALIAALSAGSIGSVVLLVATVVCFVFSAVLLPRTNAARDRGETHFSRLHAYTIGANAVAFFCAVSAVVRLAVG
jgi:predicted membrane channel-forming protein YqfA (hemolysin III family)